MDCMSIKKGDIININEKISNMPVRVSDVTSKRIVVKTHKGNYTYSFCRRTGLQKSGKCFISELTEEQLNRIAWVKSLNIGDKVLLSPIDRDYLYELTVLEIGEDHIKLGDENSVGYCDTDIGYYYETFVPYKCLRTGYIKPYNDDLFKKQEICRKLKFFNFLNLSLEKLKAIDSILNE